MVAEESAWSVHGVVVVSGVRCTVGAGAGVLGSSGHGSPMGIKWTRRGNVR